MNKKFLSGKNTALVAITVACAMSITYSSTLVETVKTLETTNSEQQQTITTLEDTVIKKDEEVTKLSQEHEATVGELNNTIDNLNIVIDDLNNRIKELSVPKSSPTAVATNYTALGEYRISFYDTSYESIEKYSEPITASGLNLRGKSIYDRYIACPPDIALGSKVYLDFYELPQLSGLYTCVDRGGAIQGNKIDVFYEDYNMEGTVWDLGIKYAQAYLVVEK